MKARFGSGAIAVLTSVVVLSSSLSVVGVSAGSARSGPQFSRVHASTVGAVDVRHLPAPSPTASSKRLHRFLPIRTQKPASHSSTIPVTSVAGGAAMATTSTEQVLTGFTGVTLSQQVSALGNDQAVTPPDPQIAAGPLYLLEMVNSSGTVWTKSGTLVKIFDLNAFFKVPSGYTFSDPRVLYDALSGRWFASGIAFVTPTYGSELVFGVSATDDPSGAWNIYSADNSPNVTHDQPKIGVSSDKVAFSFNDFLSAALFQGASTWVFGKSAMLQGLSSIPGQATGPDPRRVSIVPAIELSDSSTEFMTYNNSDCSYSGCNVGYPSVGLVSLTGDPTNGTLAWNESDPGIAGTSQPPAADQPGLPGSIQTNDDRFLTTVYQNGMLWTVGNDACTPPGDTAARPCPRLIQLSTAGATVQQNFDLGSTGRGLYYPAVHLDSAGDMFVVYNVSSSTDYVGVRITGQPAGSAPQFVVTPQTIQPGQGLYTCFTRWGDYSGAGLDPANPSNVWVVSEYAGASSTNCEWATFVAELTFGPTASPDYSLSVTPSSQSVARGGTTSYTVTTTELNGFSGSVTLSVSGLPNRASGSFNPNPATTSSVLTIATSRPTHPGTYTLTITGTSGGLS
ncbi:MAG TPA: hypothetical protein VE951_00550, partial [Candidatus Angelobacter sp.]|nr:hypothetical protein [Candidatus Angelobacter sp.]